MNGRINPLVNRRIRGYDYARSARRMHSRGAYDGLMYDNPPVYPPNRYSDSENERYNHERAVDYARGRRHDGCSGEYYQPIEFMGKFNGYYGGGQQEGGFGELDDYARRRRDYGYGDYHHESQSHTNGAYLLTDEELRRISEDLFRTIDEKDRQFLTKENIRRKVDEIGIKFERFTFEELYAVMLMLFKDYNKILGTANIDIYPKLARAFLEDDDAAVRNGEKLAMYYDYIVMGGM